MFPELPNRWPFLSCNSRPAIFVSGPLDPRVFHEAAYPISVRFGVTKAIDLSLAESL